MRLEALPLAHAVDEGAELADRQVADEVRV
jgi:hypothetical protein